jgi:hypothetical protein
MALSGEVVPAIFSSSCGGHISEDQAAVKTLFVNFPSGAQENSVMLNELHHTGFYPVGKQRNHKNEFL